MRDELKKTIAEVVPTMEGWCSEEKARAMAELILREKPLVVVEIGVFGGRSLVPQALALRENGKGVIYGIDPWKLDSALEGENGKSNDDWWKNNVNLHEIHQLCVEAIWRQKLDEWCVLVRTPSQACHALFPMIDVLHIDGNHSEVASCRDVLIYAPKVKTGGYIWFDDVDWATTGRAVQLLEQSAEKVSQVGSCSLYRKS